MDKEYPEVWAILFNNLYWIVSKSLLWVEKLNDQIRDPNSRFDFTFDL